jgi:hypothetical protein
VNRSIYTRCQLEYVQSWHHSTLYAVRAPVVTVVVWRSVRQKPPSQAAEATLHDEGCGFDLEAFAAVLAPVRGTRQAKSQGRKMATAAQKLQTLLDVTHTAPQLQGQLSLKRAVLRQHEPQLRKRLHTMQLWAAAAKDGRERGSHEEERQDAVDLGEG